MRSDYHVHSNYSDDSNYLMRDVVLDAIDLQLDEICFCDHVDYGIKLDHHNLSIADKINYIMNVDYPSYLEEIDQLSKVYGEKIKIKKGLEFGVQTHTIPLYEELFYKYDFDFIILSCHQVENLEFWTQDFQKGKSQKQYNEGYYHELLKVVKAYKNYSVLGHLDLIKRYDKKGLYPFRKVKPIIKEILQVVVGDGKGIEVNTSSFRYGFEDLMPSTEILKMYLDLGGKIVTIGSDSHHQDHLGSNIDHVKKLLKELGFEYHCTFEGMEPRYHKL